MACKWHGGRRPGPERPTYRSGRYSKDLPSRFLQKYEEAQRDPELLSLRSEINLIDIRLSELVQALDPEGPVVKWQRLLEVAGRPTPDPVTKLEELLAVIYGGSGFNESEWNQVLGAIEKRTKVVESERKRLVEMHQMISVEKLTVLIGAIVETITRNVKDRPSLVAIHDDLRGLLSTGGPVRIRAPDGPPGEENL